MKKIDLRRRVTWRGKRQTLRQLIPQVLARADASEMLAFASDVIRGRWPEAEPAIMKGPKSIQYARFVIKGRWPEAESFIMEDPESICNYAEYVIKGRWPEAEPVIMKYPRWAYWYTLRVRECGSGNKLSRWPEAEPIILQDPESAYLYACLIIGGRWPEAEPIIMKDIKAAYRYARNILKKRWPEAEPLILQDLETAVDYWTDVHVAPVSSFCCGSPTHSSRWIEFEKKYIKYKAPESEFHDRDEWEDGANKISNYVKKCRVPFCEDCGTVCVCPRCGSGSWCGSEANGMFILSAEGMPHYDEKRHTMHVILGCFPTLKEALDWYGKRTVYNERVALTYPDGRMVNVSHEIESLKAEVEK